MKKIFYVIVVATLFTACKSNSNKGIESNKDLLLLSDSANKSNGNLSDTASAAAHHTNIPSRNYKTSSSNNTNSSNSETTTNSSNNSNTSTSTNRQKKGWSKAAKGATIGAVGGAVVGAVIGHNAKGAVIGGVVGGTGGYIIGRNKDKKDGRVKHQ